MHILILFLNMSKGTYFKECLIYIGDYLDTKKLSTGKKKKKKINNFLASPKCFFFFFFLHYFIIRLFALKYSANLCHAGYYCGIRRVSRQKMNCVIYRVDCSINHMVFFSFLFGFFIGTVPSVQFLYNSRYSQPCIYKCKKIFF